jgi:hypothetical protein
MPSSTPQSPYEEVEKILLAAFHALRSYQFGNSSEYLAEHVASTIEWKLKVWREEGKL